MRSAELVGASRKMQSSACAHQRVHHRYGGARMRIAGGDVRNQRLALFRTQRRESRTKATHNSIPSCFAIAKISLSPRPERFTTMDLSRLSVGASTFAYA